VLYAGGGPKVGAGVSERERDVCLHDNVVRALIKTRRWILSAC